MLIFINSTSGSVTGLMIYLPSTSKKTSKDDSTAVTRINFGKSKTLLLNLDFSPYELIDVGQIT